MKAIPIEQLSKTFQDAIAITRQLGIQYIWIDALCIIQDSDIDWERESAKMGQIYSSSYCNLAASSARDGSQGMLNHRNTEALQPLKLFIHDVICHIEPIVESVFEANVEQGPLMNRGWVFQERILSRRNLHFTSTQLLWECNTLSTFAGSSSIYAGQPKKSVPLATRDHIHDFVSHRDLSCAGGRVAATTNSLIDCSNVEPIKWRDQLTVLAGFERIKDQGFSVKELYSKWDLLVNTYSRTKLTKHTDKLVALGGLAESWQQQLDDEYLAGLWRTNLTRNLLWCVATRSELDDMPERPATYVAPSWSWASIIGNITTLPAYINIRRSLVIVSDVVIEPTGPSKFAQAKAGYIELYGRIARVKVNPGNFRQPKGSSYNTFFVPLRHTAEYDEYAVDSVFVSIDVAASDAPTVESDDWWFLPLAMCESSIPAESPEYLDLLGLVLQEITTNSKLFRRIGWFRCGGSCAEFKINALTAACQSFDGQANKSGLEYRFAKEGDYLYLVKVI
jgi:hypothetical protein